MSRILTVVAAQVRPVPFDPAATLQKFEEEVRMLRAAFPMPTYTSSRSST